MKDYGTFVCANIPDRPRYAALARGIAAVCLGGLAAGTASAEHEGLPFTEPFDDSHLSDADRTSADWGVSSPGFLTMPASEPLNGPFDPSAAGADVGTTAHTSRALALADLNGDGLLDLVEGNARTNGVYLNESGSFPARVDVSADTLNTRGVATADMDGDGDLDIVTANLSGVPRLYLNAGDGVQYVGSDISPTPAKSDGIAVADFNGDGHPDVVVANQDFDHDLIYFHTSDPAAPFGADGVEGTPVHEDIAQHAQAVLAGDLDHDGDQDIVTVNELQQNLAFLNDGAGNFTHVAIGAEEDNSQTAAIGDLNGDGFLDIVVGSYPPGTVNRIYFNSGDPAAPFSAATTPVDFTVENDPSYTHDLEVADLDNDGDLDIVVATAGLGLPDPNVTRFTNRYYLNDGTGSFAPSMDIGADMDVTNAVAIGDVDGDGQVDVVAGNEERDEADIASAAPNRLYRNVGMPSGAEPVLQLRGHAASVRVDTEAEPIEAVSLDAAFDPRGLHNDADFWVSSNGGASWLRAEPGGPAVVFPAATRGTDLRWRVVLSALSPVGAGELALDSVTLEAAEAPAEPMFTSTPVTDATAGVEYLYEIAATEPDGEALTLTADALPDWLVLTDSTDGTGTLTGTPGEEHVGDHPVELVATDASGETATQAFTITVAAGAESSPPSFTSQPTTEATADEAYAYTVAASDPDEGDTLTITASAAPEWLALTDNGDGTAELTGTPSADAVGDHEVVLQVADSAGATAEQSFTVSVAAASPPASSPDPAPSSSGGSGSAGLAELLGLGGLVMLIRRRRRG